MVKIDIFELASLELKREGKDPNKNLSDLLDKAIEIRRWLDKHGHNTARKILQGAKIYNYDNKIKAYQPAI